MKPSHHNPERVSRKAPEVLALNDPRCVRVPAFTNRDLVLTALVTFLLLVALPIVLSLALGGDPNTPPR